MKSKCPNSNTIHDTGDDATTQPSRRAVMVLIAVIGIAGGWTTGFFCGGILTKPNRQKVNAEIAAMQETAAADRLAAEELRTQYAELEKFSITVLYDFDRQSKQLRQLTQQVSTLTSPPPGGLVHLEEKSDRPPRFTSSGVRIADSFGPDGCNIVGHLTSTLKTYPGDSLFNLSVFDRQKRLLNVTPFGVSDLTRDIPKPFFVFTATPSPDIYYYQITPYIL